MDQITQLQKLIGKHIKSQQAKRADWLGFWPEINQDGYIVSILDGDSIPEDATLIDWSTDSIRGKPVVVDGDHGFEAVL